MATTANEYYLRSILLLTEGGSYISKKVLYREVDKNGGDLDIQLKQYATQLKHELHKKQYEKLFPTCGTSDVEKWDLQMVIGVVHVLFRKTLSLEERSKLRCLKVNRNEVLAHNSSVSLDEEEYTVLQEELKDAIIKLSSGFGQDVQDKCLEYITKYKTGPLDIKSAIENMRRLQDNDAMLQKVLIVVENTNLSIHTIEKQLSALEQRLLTELNGLKPEVYQKKIKVGVHTELKVCGPSQEWINLMEKTLNDIFNEADKTAGGNFSEIEKTVENFLEIIRDKANFKGSTLKCVVLEFECTTYAKLHSLLLYLNSLEYREELEKIRNSLMKCFDVDEHIEISSTVTQECLHAIFTELDKECDGEDEQPKESDVPVLEENETLDGDSLAESEKSKALQLAFECTSVEGLRHIWNLFQKGGATEHLNKIADALSKHFGVNVSLTAHLDLDEFKAVIEESALEMKLLTELNGLKPEAYQKKIKVGFHTELTLCGPSKKWIHLMEKTLNDIFNEADKTARGNFSEIEKTVEKFLEMIRDKANFKGSTLKCVVLKFECTTYAKLHSLLLYMNSLEYKEELKKIGNSLMRCFDVEEQIEISSTVTQECLQTIITELVSEVHENEQNIAVERETVPDSDREKSSKMIPALDEKLTPSLTETAPDNDGENSSKVLRVADEMRKPSLTETAHDNNGGNSSKVLPASDEIPKPILTDDWKSLKSETEKRTYVKDEYDEELLANYVLLLEKLDPLDCLYLFEDEGYLDRKDRDAITKQFPRTRTHTVRRFLYKLRHMEVHAFEVFLNCLRHQGIVLRETKPTITESRKRPRETQAHSITDIDITDANRSFTENLVVLLDELEPIAIAELLLQKGVISFDQHEEIHNMSRRKDRTMFLLSLIADGLPRSYSNFLSVLQNLGYDYVLKRLESKTVLRETKPTITESRKRTWRTQTHFVTDIDIMDAKRSLTENEAVLLDELEPIPIADDLLEHGVISFDQHEEIHNMSRRKDRTMFLLSLIADGLPGYYAMFLFVLLDLGYDYVLKRLKSKTEGDTESPIPREVHKFDKFGESSKFGEFDESSTDVTVEYRNLSKSELIETVATPLDSIDFVIEKIETG